MKCTLVLLFISKAIQICGVIFLHYTVEIRAECLRYNIDEQHLEKTPFTSGCLSKFGET